MSPTKRMSTMRYTVAEHRFYYYYLLIQCCGGSSLSSTSTSKLILFNIRKRSEGRGIPNGMKINCDLINNKFISLRQNVQRTNPDSGGARQFIFNSNVTAKLSTISHSRFLTRPCCGLPTLREIEFLRSLSLSQTRARSLSVFLALSVSQAMATMDFSAENFDCFRILFGHQQFSVLQFNL